MAEDQGQTQEVRYRVSVDPGDVHSTIQEIEAAANRASSSITAMAGNILSTLRSQASDSFGVTNMASRDAMMMAYGNMPRPGMGQMGPSMVSPLGLPSVNMFRPGAFNGGYNYQQPFTAMNAPMFAPPPSPLLYPTHPAVQAQARSIAGRGEGGFGDVGRQLWRLGALGRGSVVPDSMNETVYRHIEGSSEAFGRNMGKFVGGDLPGLGLSAASMAAFAMGAGPVGWGLGLTAMAAGVPLAAMNQAGKPYAMQADMLREFTAPYLRGNRLGPGMSGRETAQTQRQMVDMVNADKFFTSSEYTELLQASNDVGVFQFSGSKDQMMRSIEKMADNLKTLHALGKTAEERLRMYDQMYSTFGISQHADSKRFANIATLAQVTGMATGTDAATAMERAQMTAQQGMSQGLGPAFAGKIGLYNQMSAGAMFRSNTFAGGFANAYFGGQQGLSESLNQADLAMARSPWGQMALISAIDSKGNFMDGASMDMQSVMGRLGKMNPYQMLEAQMFSPLYTQGANGAGFTRKMESDAIDRYKRMFPEASGEQIMAMLGRDFGWTQDQTIAKTLELAQAKEVQSDMVRNAMDTGRQVALESRRGMGLDRWMDKAWEGAMAPLASADARFGEWAHRKFSEPFQRFMTGENAVALGQAGALGMDPVAMRAQLDMKAKLEAQGFRMTADNRSVQQLTRDARMGMAADMFRENRYFQEQVRRGAAGAGINTDDLQAYLEGGRFSDPKRRAKVEGYMLDMADKLAGSQAKHITTIQGMNDFERMSDTEQSRVLDDSVSMLKDPALRTRIEAVLADTKADDGKTMERLKKVLSGKADGNLTEEDELMVGRRIEAMVTKMDPGNLSFSARRRLNNLRGIKDSVNQDGKAAQKAVDERNKWAKEKLGAWDTLAAGNGRDEFYNLITDGDSSTVNIVEQGVIWQRLGSLGSDAERAAAIEEIRQGYGLKSADEVYAKLGIDKGVSTSNLAAEGRRRREHMRKLADQSGITKYDDMVKDVGLRMATEVGQGVRNRNESIQGLTSSGVDQQFGANVTMMLKGLNVSDAGMKSIETALGGKSIAEFFTGADSEQQRMDKLGKFAGALSGVAGIETIVDKDLLKLISGGSANSHALLKRSGLSDKDIKDMTADQRHQAASIYGKSVIDMMMTKDGNLMANNANANMPSREALGALTSALKEVTSQSKEITQVADKLNFDKISKVLEYINNSEVGGKQKTDSVTIDANTIVINGKGGKEPVVTHNGTGITDNNKRDPIQPKDHPGSRKAKPPQPPR